ncbi:MAG: zinc ribbon domain-containing protein [Eggerthellaceae bacterium]|nr:zinc ribbon domain-containing protein [Eggerthellaceae bacterium]
MYCANCGKELVKGANFCTACGSRSAVAERMVAAEEVAPAEVGGVSSALASGRSRSRLRMSPLVLLVLVLALTAGIAAAAYYVYTEVYQPSLAQDEANEYEDASNDELSDGGGAVTDASNASNDFLFNGWWQSVGQTQSIFHHIENGVEYIYQIPPDVMAAFPVDEWDDYAFNSKRTVESTAHFEVGEVGAAVEPCDAISFEGGVTFLMFASDIDTLVRQDIDGSNYSVSGSLVRMHDIPRKLSELAEQTEVASASTVQAENYHFAFDHFEFELPEYWRDRVTVEQEDGRTVIYAKDVHDAGYGGALAWVWTGGEDATRAKGDVGSKWIYDHEYAPGQYVIVWAATPAVCVVSTMITDGCSLEESVAKVCRDMPPDLFEEFIDLSSGGRLSTVDITVPNKEGVGELDCYAFDAFPPLIDVR